jgi:hypothetical protein
MLRRKWLRIALPLKSQGREDNFPGIGYCMLETGESLAGFAYGNFFAEPSPQIELHNIGKSWHLGIILFEQWWLTSHSLKRETLHLAITLGGRTLGAPISL